MSLFRCPARVGQRRAFGDLDAGCAGAGDADHPCRRIFGTRRGAAGLLNETMLPLPAPQSPRLDR